MTAKRREPILDVLPAVSKYTQNASVTYDSITITYDSLLSQYDNNTQTEVTIKGGLPKILAA